MSKYTPKRLTNRQNFVPYYPSVVKHGTGNLLVKIEPNISEDEKSKNGAENLEHLIYTQKQFNDQLKKGIAKALREKEEEKKKLVEDFAEKGLIILKSLDEAKTYRYACKQYVDMIGGMDYTEKEKKQLRDLITDASNHIKQKFDEINKDFKLYQNSVFNIYRN